MGLGLTIGLRALLTAEKSIDVIGQNIANAATPGYSRKSVSLGATDPWLRLGIGSQGTGVKIADLRRVHDGLLESRLRSQGSELGQARVEREMLSFLDGFFSNLDGNGVSGRLNGFFDSVSAVTAAPSDPSLRGGLLQQSKGLAIGFRQMATQLQNVANDAYSAMDSTVTEINGLASQIAELNDEIVRASAVAEPSDLLDRRNVLLRDLSELADVSILDRRQGSVDVLIDGLLLVSGTTSDELNLSISGDNSVDLTLDGESVSVRGGRLRGLVNVAESSLDRDLANLNEIALSVIRETNRIHATGIPASGPYNSLTSRALGAGNPGIRFSSLDLPIPVQEGQLIVNVVDETSGAITQSVLGIDPATQSLTDFAGQLNSLQHLSASLDSTGRLRIAAETGFGFDFSNRVDENPDDTGTFGSQSALLASAAGPFALANGDSLTIDVDGIGPQTVTFSSADFADISNATAAEVAAVISSNVTGASARVVDGRMVIESGTGGAASSLLVADGFGSPAAALGLSTSLETGSEVAVAVTLEGNPQDVEGQFFLRPSGDGTIGVTPDLTVEVVDADGNSLGNFEVGQNYTPGDSIEVIPGVRMTLTAGEVSQSAGDFFSFRAVQDSDSSDILTALELGAFFTGTDATNIQLSDRIVEDSRNIAGGQSGAVGDGGNFLRLVELRDHELTELDGRSILDAYADVVADVGLRAQGATASEEAQNLVVGALEARRNEISGVNVNEEMLKLVELEQLHSAAARYLQTVNDFNEVLVNLI